MFDFPPQTPMPFTKEAIEQLCPYQFGCYGLLNQAGFVYIGKGDIRTRLLAHLRGETNPLISLFIPTHFMIVVTPHYDQCEQFLIRQYVPVANRRVG